ncbi:MAG: hypothetical protein ACRD59_14665 [Candidatus Acidiferrales bacterium]
MKTLRPFAILLCVFIASSAIAQDAAKRLTNQDVIDMTALGLSDDVIIAKIRSVTGADAAKYDTSVDGLKALKAANVSDAVIKVMINPAPPPPSIVAATAPMTLDPNLPPPEVGLYWKDGPTFVFIQGAAISRTKAGGRAASFATDGIRGQHWDAVLEGPTSKNHVKDRRPIFYIYVPDGSSAADYALVKLQKKGDRREFQVGSFGGIGGGKSGVKRDKEVPCSAEHVGIRTYKVTIDSDLKPGEYGFFMGTGSQSNMSSGRVSSSSGGAAGGRVYDFNIPE